MAPQVAIANAEAKSQDINVRQDGAQDSYVPESPVFSPVGFACLSQACCDQSVREESCHEISPATGLASRVVVTDRELR